MKTIRMRKRNGERAERADRAFDGYIQAQVAEGSDYEDEPEDTRLTDLLTDLMHFADRQQINFGHCLQMAEMHHEAERNGE